MFVGCYTGINLAEGLLGASIEAGARCAIGFKDTISCEPSNDLMWNFWNRYNEFPDYNIQNIIDMAINDCGDYYDRSGNLVETNLDSYVILVREENGEILAYERE